MLKQIVRLWSMGKFLKQQSIYRHTEKRKRNQKIVLLHESGSVTGFLTYVFSMDHLPMGHG
jgi:hypothetical protein